MEEEFWLGMSPVKVAIGIDPGKDGYITVIKFETIESFSIPKLKKAVDFHGLAELVMRIAEGCDPYNTIVAIENVHAISKAAAGTTFNFGHICGAIEMAVIMCGLPVVKVAPKKWQKEMHEGVKPSEDKKQMSLVAAKRLFPNHNLLRTPLCKKPDDNLVDSLLIAEYARRNYL